MGIGRWQGCPLSVSDGLACTRTPFPSLVQTSYFLSTCFSMSSDMIPNWDCEVKDEGVVGASSQFPRGFELERSENDGNPPGKTHAQSMLSLTLSPPAIGGRPHPSEALRLQWGLGMAPQTEQSGRWHGGVAI